MCPTRCIIAACCVGFPADCWQSELESHKWRSVLSHDSEIHIGGLFNMPLQALFVIQFAQSDTVTTVWSVPNYAAL